MSEHWHMLTGIIDKTTYKINAFQCNDCIVQLWRLCCDFIFKIEKKRKTKTNNNVGLRLNIFNVKHENGTTHALVTLNHLLLHAFSFINCEDFTNGDFFSRNN